MNYNWDWGVFFKSTGVGSETYLDWFIWHRDLLRRTLP
jgi:glutamate/aspartate transport system permease protein